MATEVYEWVLSGILGGQFVQTVQCVSSEVATPINPFFQALKIAQDMLTSPGMIEDLLNCLPSDYEATSLRVRKVNGSGGPTAVILAGDFLSTVGTRTGSISSAQVNPLIIWIPTTAPDKVGKLFLPGVSEDDIDDMVLSSALINAVNTFAANYADTHTYNTSDTWQGAVFRRTPKTGDLIVAGQLSPLIGTQRRRLRPV